MSSTKIAPFVKWAGGKRQLMAHIEKRMPYNFNNYYEPFVGGGAVLFNFLPQNAVINDINKELINTYKCICKDVDRFIDKLHEIDNSIWDDGKEYYYAMRTKYNDKIKNNQYDGELAALFVFLNKHCFNGLYRVNKKGEFNVPYNNSRKSSYDEENIRLISSYLKNISIFEGDFQSACQNAQKGDFVFFDSPYAPLNPSSFEAYTKEGFSIEEHTRLANLYDELSSRGCFCMLTNHNTELINKLYSNKGYSIETVSVKRMINSDAKNRVGEEVIICNYDIEE